MHDFENALQSTITQHVNMFHQFNEQQERYKANLLQSMAAVASEEAIAMENYAKHYTEVYEQTNERAQSDRHLYIEEHQQV